MKNEPISEKELSRITKEPVIENPDSATNSGEIDTDQNQYQKYLQIYQSRRVGPEGFTYLIKETSTQDKMQSILSYLRTERQSPLDSISYFFKNREDAISEYVDGKNIDEIATAHNTDPATIIKFLWAINEFIQTGPIMYK